MPSAAEIANCRPGLEREIAVLRPELIVPLGRLATAQFQPARPSTAQIGTTYSASLPVSDAPQAPSQ